MNPSWDLLGVYGASGCGRGILPLLRKELLSTGGLCDSLVFIDDSPPAKILNGHRVLTFEQFLAASPGKKGVALAVAAGAIRARLAARLASHEISPLSIHATTVQIMDEVEIGPGSILSPFVTLTSNIRVGQFFHANLYSYIEHDCVIGDFVTFAPAVKCNGNVHIEDFAYIGSGAVIRQGKPGRPLVIGRGAVVGMGAVVTKDVPPGVTVVGNPAKVLPR